MGGLTISEADRQQLAAMGITEDTVRMQLEIFQRSSFHLHLSRICTLEDGIQKISREEADHYVMVHNETCHDGRFLKFVPASGAATRMFQCLLQVLHQADAATRKKAARKVDTGDASAKDLERFLSNLKRFAFYEELKETMARDGLDMDSLLQQGKYSSVLDYLLTERGLCYASLPKCLLKFHHYPSGSRSAFEEHLVEAAHYVQDRTGLCRLHFTISQEHEEKLKYHLKKVLPLYEARFQVRFRVDISFQKPTTCTVAVDMENRLVRDREGRLVFRPGGHGALLENLNELDEDFVYIKNIDNVVPDRLKAHTVYWKKVMGGYLVEVQKRVHTLVRRLKREASESIIEESARLARDRLLIHLPESFRLWTLEQKREFLLRKLNRPIRVCGVVQNVGEPGGAPFWVLEKDGTASLQIVEKAQVNFESPEQCAIWNASTHFNPVHLVCALHDHEGNRFDLTRHVNPEAVFISQKYDSDRHVKALEHPGLWNGAMADWISLFVEVPKITFNPVKTVNDLLRDEHQPE